MKKYVVPAAVVAVLFLALASVLFFPNMITSAVLAILMYFPYN